jgi:hypothetical protein
MHYFVIGAITHKHLCLNAASSSRGDQIRQRDRGHRKFEFVTPHWRSDIGLSKEQTGEKLLGLLSPPWRFAQLRVKKVPVRKLILDDAQLSYEFIE